MEIIIWIIIAIVVFSVKSNKKKQDEARKKAQQSTAWNPPDMRGTPIGQAPLTPVLTNEPVRSAVQESWSWQEDAAESFSGESPAVSMEAGEAWPWPVVSEAGASVQAQWSGEGLADANEGVSRAKNAPAPNHRPAQTTLKNTFSHTLRPAPESRGHAHMETSMTGEVVCPSDLAADALRPVFLGTEPIVPTAGSLRLDREGVVTGLLYMEILGKPKALRQRRPYRS